ncbi:MAG: ribonuclease R [Hyphomicrobiaceae bacterium]
MARTPRSSQGGKTKAGSKAKDTRKSKRTAASAARSMPTKEDILAFVGDATGKVGKREIARAFGIKGPDKVALKAMLRDMTDEGLLKGNRKKLKQPGRLPLVTVIDIVDRDSDGEFVCEPSSWDENDDGPKPRILLTEAGPRRGAAAGLGDRVLARIQAIPADAQDGYAFEAKIIKKLAREERQLLGIYRANTERKGGIIEPVDRRQLRSHIVHGGDEAKAQDGDLVRFTLEGNRRLGPPRAKVAAILGNPDDQRQVSLIALHAHGIPEAFPPNALAELDDLPALSPNGREDLRDIPLITIDPPDARDHDDAVWAGADPDPKNTDGWIVIVAIADVAFYVRPGSALDRAALERANSVYFPDRVVPMLPEVISNDLCSLRENEERPCMAVRMIFDKAGKKRSHTFLRGIMRSHAKLSYVQAQRAIDGKPDRSAKAHVETILKPLWAAYAALHAAREDRAPLDLDLPERKIRIGEDGRVAEITVPDRLDAHKLIEEFMIQANVAAAEALEVKRSPLIYRTHDAPSPEKLGALKDFLETLDISVPKAGALKPANFNHILAKADGSEHDALVNEVILRAQSQAEYTDQNYGHFGLNLRKYAHFTSPIRRYADLIVHRALISAHKFGDDGLPDETIQELAEIAAVISERERRAMAAERETVDRLISGYLADRIGAEFPARISGVTRSGLFVRLDETGADGFVPAASIGDDYYRHDEDHRALIGDRTNEAYVLGDAVKVRLVEAIPDAGALRFDILSPGRRLKHAGKSKRRAPQRGRSKPKPRTRGRRS